MLIYTIATVLTLGLVAWLYPGHKETRVAESIVGKERTEIKTKVVWSLTIKKKKILSCILAMIPFLAVMSARWCVGVDTWYTYTPEYLAMKSESVPLTGEEEEIMQNSSRLIAKWFDREKPKEELNEIPLEDVYSVFRTTARHKIGRAHV